MELQTTRSAHKQRLERFKLLKENHDLVLKQLATYEEGSMYVFFNVVKYVTFMIYCAVNFWGYPSWEENEKKFSSVH